MKRNRSTARRTTKKLRIEQLEQKTLLTTIDFNDAPGHNLPIPANHYPDITLANAVWVQGSWAYDGSGALGVANGVVATTEDWQFPGTTSPIEIHFAAPVTLVTVTAMHAGYNGAMIEAYDGSTLVGSEQVVHPGTFNAGGRDILSVSAANITKVHLLQVKDPLLFGFDGVHFDNLQFTGTQPDIVALDVNISGDIVNISWEIKGDDLSSDTSASLYWSSDDVFDSADTFAATHPIQGVNRQAGLYNTSLQLSTLAEPSTDSKYLLLVVDEPSGMFPNGMIDEIDETNSLAAGSTSTSTVATNSAGNRMPLTSTKSSKHCWNVA